ncbi:HNH endonuclease family protein [Nocardia sp. NPDC056100]|uniref:HNH endonuclease family protein n=1 Tax=Nocardia sp. NPDC056100 TaxID=3345712 RepID=UPI0035D9E427
MGSAFRIVLATLGAAIVVLSTTGCEVISPPVAPAPGSPARAYLETMLDRVRTVPARVRPGGYDRSCKSGQRCVFGPAWSDAQDGPGGRDGCDTRNNVLARQLSGAAFRPGGKSCVVVGGTLDDPYTGTHIVFDKGDAKAVQIDHVFPLAAAWDLGASGWTLERRMRFANDLDLELLAVDGKANQDKGDRTPADWLPPARANHCFYAGKYLTVALEYDLPLTNGDQKALRRIAKNCP